MTVPQNEDKELLQSWINSILFEASDKLTDWESNFVDSISDQLVQRGKLSLKQTEILERIYATKTK